MLHKQLPDNNNEINNNNKMCARRVWLTRYPPTASNDTGSQVQHWAKMAQTDHVTLRP